ncbi:MAG: DUF6110 family protein [Oscillospiraceae bacterium]|nr:DUF6110 family protein [Oscillospiraceae bacterium]
MLIPVTIAKIGVAAAAVALGTAGVIILTSDEAKKVYTKITAAALRAKDAVDDAVTDIARNCSEIIDDAVAYNEQRAAANENGDAMVEEAWEEDAETEITDVTDTEEVTDAPEDTEE